MLEEHHGAGFANDVFYNDLVRFENELTENQKNEITDIFVVGGWNDRNSNQVTLYNKMSIFNNYAKNVYPNSKITIGYVGWSNPFMRDTEENRTTVFKCINNYITNCSMLKWNYIKNSQYILHNYNTSYWEEDGVHPSQLGQNELGKELSFGFINGFCDIKKLNVDSFYKASPSGISVSLSDDRFFSGIDNENAYLIKYNQANFYIDINDTLLDCSGSVAYEIMELKDGFYVGTSTFNSTTIPIMIAGSFNGVNVKTFGFASLYMTKGKIYIKPTVFYNNNVVQNLPVKYIYLPCFTLSNSSQIS